MKKLTAIAAIILLALCVVNGSEASNDNPNGFGLRTFSLEDLAEKASSAVAYIETEYASGSGFVVDPSGIIVTNYHVMEGASTAQIEIDDNIYQDILILAADRGLDLALVKVNAVNLTWLPLALGPARPGQSIAALGSPEGLKGTISSGNISAVGRRLEGIDIDLIQMTAPISPGSSGGPLINMQGEVVGVNTFTYQSGQNLNFAVPASYVQELLNQDHQLSTIDQVFGSKSSSYYNHVPGELAVVMSWEGQADLDLEIWSEDFVFLGQSWLLGDSHDFELGGRGEEYFVFRNWPDTDSSQEHDLHRDFSRGRYIVSPYFVGGLQGLEEVSITIYYPSGEVEVFTETLELEPPYDQWFALLIDVEQGETKLLDFFADANLIALLEWDSTADLDLAVWDYYYEDYFYPFELGGHDVVDGSQGLEVFRFGNFRHWDLTTGKMDLDVYMDNPGNPTTTAIVTLVAYGEVIDRFVHTFDPDPAGEYFWEVIYVDAETHEYQMPDYPRKLLNE